MYNFGIYFFSLGYKTDPEFLVLLLYDYILTFDLEIEAVWSAKKLNFAKLLFFLVINIFL